MVGWGAKYLLCVRWECIENTTCTRSQLEHLVLMYAMSSNPLGNTLIAQVIQGNGAILYSLKMESRN